MLHPVLYLTGAPASGKSTLARELETVAGARIYRYGEALMAHPSLAGVTYNDLRGKSAELVKPALIVEIDAALPSVVSEWRLTAPVVIDSHAVTNEPWGLRATGYGPADLRAIGISHLLCLIAPPATLERRIADAPDGRKPAPAWKLEQLNGALVALVMAYGHTLGAPVLLLDASLPTDELRKIVLDRCGLDGEGR